MSESQDHKKIYALLDQQDRWISLFLKSDHSRTTNQIGFDDLPLDEHGIDKREDVFTKFCRGIFFVKECLLENHGKFNAAERMEIQRRLEKQTKAIDECYHFLERSLRLTI